MRRLLEHLHDYALVYDRRRAGRFALALVLAATCWTFNPVLVSAQRPDDVPAFEPEVPASGFEAPGAEPEVPQAEPDVPGGQAEVPPAEPTVDDPAPDVEVEGELEVTYED
ncbi:MAG TPA: hypothetical protein VFB75_18190, partial [Burkholderiales bacterium]|nr:hypothetical protein [Burkholderiales bacterium]